MEHLPLLSSLVFILTTILAIFMFWQATTKSMTALYIMLIWLIIQTLLSVSGFYSTTNTIPPRIILFIFPPLLFIIAIFITSAGKRFIDGLDPGKLVLLHIIRIPVEITLYMLFLEKKVPQLMTFAGGNYDIISGLTAPVIYYFGFVKKIMARELILVWNMICLALLLSIVYHAILSVPSHFQKLAFDQPNTAILQFPYALLPSLIVPMVLLSHLATIRLLQKKIFVNGYYEKKFIS